MTPNVSACGNHLRRAAAWGTSLFILRKCPHSVSLTAREAAHVTQHVRPLFSFYMFDDFLIT